jgi:hypothetical protein
VAPAVPGRHLGGADRFAPELAQKLCPAGHGRPGASGPAHTAFAGSANQVIHRDLPEQGPILFVVLLVYEVPMLQVFGGEPAL